MFIHNSYCIISFTQFILSNISHRDKETSKLCIENRICQKTEQSVVICTPTILLLLQFFWKIREPGKFVYWSYSKRISILSRFLLKMRISFLSAKVSVFQQDQINYHPTWSQRLYLALYWKKIIEHDYYSILIMWTYKNGR